MQAFEHLGGERWAHLAQRLLESGRSSSTDNAAPAASTVSVAPAAVSGSGPAVPTRCRAAMAARWQSASSLLR